MNIKNWVGADLSERSFRQIYSGHLERIGQFDGHATNSAEREVTLFDNQMVICYLVSKTILKKSNFLVKFKNWFLHVKVLHVNVCATITMLRSYRDKNSEKYKKKDGKSWHVGTKPMISLLGKLELSVYFRRARIPIFWYFPEFFGIINYRYHKVLVL